MECSLYLARLLVGCGEAAAATDLLQQLDADVERHELTLPEGQGAQLSLLLSKASLHLQLGQGDSFANSLLPQFTSLIDQAENNAAVVTAAKKVCAVHCRPVSNHACAVAAWASALRRSCKV
jgi:hypothetical protein